MQAPCRPQSILEGINMQNEIIISVLYIKRLCSFSAYKNAVRLNKLFKMLSTEK